VQEGRTGWIVRGYRSPSPVALADFERRIRELAASR
jgi:hypothetical protein